MDKTTSDLNENRAAAHAAVHQAGSLAAGLLAGQHIATAVADAEGFDADSLLRHAMAVQGATRTEAARLRFCAELVTTLQVLALQAAAAADGH